jgi:type IV secretion system protein VirB9
MKKLMLFLCLTGIMLGAAPAIAASRISLIYYSPDRVVAIAGHKAIQTMIEFGKDERIENVALGDSAAWQITPNKRANLIFLKPLMAKARTNMTVITDKRRYLFDLYNGGPNSRAIYTVRFIYPEDFHLAAPAPKPAAPPAEPPVINTRWDVKGDKAIRPASIYDDGASTFIAWHDTTELPAVLTKGIDGSEGPVNFTVKGEYLVIDGVAPLYILRVGKATATLTNLAPRALKPVSPQAEASMEAPGQ